MNSGIVHMDISGKWLTDHLRNLWSEGSEAAAIRIWNASFNAYATTEALNGVFLEVVSGKKQFKGWASDKGGIKLVKDNATHGHNGRCVLFTSFDDVLRLKKIHLYLEEKSLSSMRMNRHKMEAYAEYNGEPVEYNETALVKKYNSFYNDITFIAKSIGLNPVEVTNTTNMFLKGINGVEEYQEFEEFYTLEQTYFFTKYKDKMLYESSGSYSHVFGAREPEEFTSATSASIQASYESVVSNRVNNFFGYDLDMQEVKKNKAKGKKKKKVKGEEVEDLNDPDFTSGYIDLQGNFYGCPDLTHINYAEHIIEKFELKPVEGVTEEYCSYTSMKDSIIDDNGWVKVSVRRYLWDYNSHILTAKQTQTIAKLMKAWGQEIATFSTHWHSATSLEVALEKNKEECEFIKRTRNVQKV